MHKYYEAKRGKLKKTMQDFLSLVGTEISHVSGKDSDAAIEDIWHIYERDMLERFPYIGGDDASGTKNLTEAYMLVAMGEFLKEYGATMEQIGGLMTLTYERRMLKMPKLMRRLMGKMFTNPKLLNKMFLKKDAKNAENAAKNPGSFETKTQIPPEEGYDFSYHNLVCPLANFAKKYRYEAYVYAGPACIEIFGETPFEPVSKPGQLTLSKKQQELGVEYTNELSQIVNEYIPGDEYSFTIIAYPMPEIGDDYEDIFEQIIRINNLESNVYRPIHQMIINELDQAEWVHVIGQNGNQTDMKVMLHVLEHPEIETNFENCLADVNIPLGEVFTSPRLTGTHGVLNVSEVYLNDLKYVDLKLTFEDGKIKTYTCKNFDREEDNVKFVKDNLLGGRDTLPIGEFAIGTNTTAYVLANKYNMVYKLPILIVEKMGPHFAVGDTCYSWSEENILHNPDGKEIVAKDNECSILRKTDISKAYFNCHTDITIPYDEIGGIYSVHADGTRVAIIENGRFVLPGTEMLNEPFKEAE